MSGKIEWWRPELGATERERAAQVIASNYINEGDVTAEFERQIAGLTRAHHAVAVTSGTAALFLALKALGVGPGDEVIVPDVTFVASANAVTLAGAVPMAVDVDPDRLTMSVTALEAGMTAKTKAVMPVHVSGRAADMEKIGAVCSRHGLVMVEDAAEALCSRYRGRCLGTFGQAGCLSFSPNKTITTGQGGMVLTDDAAIAQRLRELKDQGRAVRGTGGADQHPVIGFNFKLTNLQAAVGLGQLERLSERLERLRQTYLIYRDKLSGVKGIRILPFDVDNGEQPQWVDALAEGRDEMEAHLARNGAGCRRFWFPLHTHPPYSRPDHDFPNSTRLCRDAIWLPSAFQMNDDDVRHICRLIREFYGA